METELTRLFHRLQKINKDQYPRKKVRNTRFALPQHNVLAYT